MSSPSATSTSSSPYRASRAAAWSRSMSRRRRTSLCASAGTTGGGAIREHDVHFQHLVVALGAQVDLDRVRIDVHVLADDLQQLALERGQVVRPAALDAPLGDDDLQALAGQAGGVLLLASEQVEQSHGVNLLRTAA